MKPPRACVCFTLAWLATTIVAAGEFPATQSPARVQVVAHRGASDQAPENTLKAIERSIADSVDWISVDVRRSRDGHHILLHDADLARTTDGTGPADALTLDELKRLDAGLKFARRTAGTPIPTLAEALALAKGHVKIILDCRDIDPARLAREVLDAGMEAQVVASGPVGILHALKTSPGRDRLALMPRWDPSLGPSAFADLAPASIELDADAATPDLCRAFHDRGLKVQARTLDSDDRPEVWDRLIAAGVDRLRTDRPEEIQVRESLKRAGPRRVKVAHHRGASRYAPENTLPAYEKAVRLGADFVEFDVRTTRDGKFFLLHDGTLDRTTAASGPIRNHDSSEIAGLDAGAWFGRPFLNTPVPTLEAFLQAVGRRAELYFDAKDIAPEALVAALRAADLIDRTVVYQGADYLARLRSIEPRLRRMPPLGDASQIDALVDRLAPYAFDTKWQILSKPLIDRCHGRGVQVFSDAIGPFETPESYRRAILDGIDLIQTDHPVRVLRALELPDSAGR